MRSPRVPFAPHGTKTACSGGASSFSPAFVASSSHSSSRGATLGAVDFHGSTLRADQQGCQNGLVLEDHSGGYRIEPLRPGGFLGGFLSSDR